MRDLSARFKGIQAAAGNIQTEQTALVMPASSCSAPDPVEKKGFEWPPEVAPPVWPRDEILVELQKGATSRALTLALQALADLAQDPAFAEAALPLAQAAKTTGEEWKRAFKTYSRYAPLLIEAGSRDDYEAACEIASGAAQEVSEIYTLIPDDPMAEQLALGVYEALSRVYENARPKV